MCSQSREKLYTTMLLGRPQTQERNTSSGHIQQMASNAVSLKKKKTCHNHDSAQQRIPGSEGNQTDGENGCPSGNLCGPITEK